MGWKAACILINEREMGYLGTLPDHDSEAAHALIEQIGLGAYQSLGLTYFDYGIYPSSPDRLMIGAYDGAAIVAERDLIFGTVTGESTFLLHQLLKRFPDAELLVLELHSGVNYFGYAFYRRGELLRTYGGSAEEGVMVETGKVQPEEQGYFAHSVVRDGVRSFELDGDTWTVDQMGEDLAFTMASRFLGGRPMEEFEWLELVVEEFEKALS